MTLYFLKACHGCGGDLVLTNDTYGPYVMCLQCARSLDLGLISTSPLKAPYTPRIDTRKHRKARPPIQLNEGRF